MATEKNIVTIGGLVIMEPIVSLTDIMVSVACFIALYNLIKLKVEGRMYLHFKLHFLTMGLATLFGGTIGHAFLYAFSDAWKLAGWLISMISLNFLERAFIAHTMQYVNEKTKFLIKTANNIELLGFMAITIYTLNFDFVEIHIGFGLLMVIFPLQLFMYFRTKDKGTKYVFVIVVLAILSAVIFIKQISTHQWFNHISISHAIMVVMVFLLYKSATILKYNNNLETKARGFDKFLRKLKSKPE
jgi:hypothetical protein